MARELGDLPDEQRCTANKRDGSGERCTQPRMYPFTVCWNHTPKTPNAIEKRATAKLERALMRRGYGTPTVHVDVEHEGANPITGLAWEIRRTAGNIEFIEEQLAQLSDGEIIWGTTRKTSKKTLADLQRELQDILGELDDGYPRISRNEDSYEQTFMEAGLHVWAQLYLRERKHYVELLKLAITSGLEHRRISIMEEHVLMVNSAITNIVSALGANPDAPEIRALVKNELAVLAQ